MGHEAGLSRLCVCVCVRVTWRPFGPSNVRESDPGSDGECPVYRFELYLSCHLILSILDSLDAPDGTRGPGGKIGIDFLCIDFASSLSLLL